MEHEAMKELEETILEGTLAITLPQGIFELDGTGRILACSTYGSGRQRKGLADIIGKPFFGQVDRMRNGDLENVFARVFRNRVPFDKVYAENEGHERRSILMMFFPDTQTVMLKID